MDIMDLHSILLEFNFIAIAIKRKEGREIEIHITT
jgi:hypothetical protein